MWNNRASYNGTDKYSCVTKSPWFLAFSLLSFAHLQDHSIERWQQRNNDSESYIYCQEEEFRSELLRFGNHDLSTAPHNALLLINIMVPLPLYEVKLLSYQMSFNKVEIAVFLESLYPVLRHSMFITRWFEYFLNISVLHECTVVRGMVLDIMCWEEILIKIVFC